MRIVAEGVEVKEQVDFLATEGCDMIQGYYYAKPMPSGDYEGRMQKSWDIILRWFSSNSVMIHSSDSEMFSSSKSEMFYSNNLDKIYTSNSKT